MSNARPLTTTDAYKPPQSLSSHSHLDDDDYVLLNGGVPRQPPQMSVPRGPQAHLQYYGGVNEEDEEEIMRRIIEESLRTAEEDEAKRAGGDSKQASSLEEEKVNVKETTVATQPEGAGTAEES